MAPATMTHYKDKLISQLMRMSTGLLPYPTIIRSNYQRHVACSRFVVTKAACCSVECFDVASHSKTRVSSSMRILISEIVFLLATLFPPAGFRIANYPQPVNALLSVAVNAFLLDFVVNAVFFLSSSFKGVCQSLCKVMNVVINLALVRASILGSGYGSLIVMMSLILL